MRTQGHREGSITYWWLLGGARGGTAMGGEVGVIGKFKYDGVLRVFLGWVWWFIPVILAPWEAKVGGLLEPRSWRLAWAT